MEKINVAELLKDCPKGMELNCLMYDGCTFEGITESESYPIKMRTPDETYVLTKYGGISEDESAKCIIFPKGKTTWEGFVPPCKFNNGDIVVDVMGTILIYQKITPHGYCGSFASLDHYNQLILRHEVYLKDNIRFATEEEKRKLFKAIKENGYSWNAETKTLEMLVEPKSDITTLKPFDRVLVRDYADRKWLIEFFSHIQDKDCMFVCNTDAWRQCIPYEGNEHLLNTTDNCDDFYVTWK